MVGLERRETRAHAHANFGIEHHGLCFQGLAVSRNANLNVGFTRQGAEGVDVTAADTDVRSAGIRTGA
jgi:hypothetical protein